MNVQLARTRSGERKRGAKVDEDAPEKFLLMVRKAHERVERQIADARSAVVRWEGQRDRLVLLAAFSAAARKEYRQADEAFREADAELKRLYATQAALNDLIGKLGGESYTSQFIVAQIWRQLAPYIK